MRSKPGRLAMTVWVALIVSGCATGEEWATWRQHATHFASGDHGLFSLRNSGTGKGEVRRSEIALARAESWWGHPITVSEEQILQR